MTIFIDDVQFKDESTFWEYISKSFGKGEKGIYDKATLKSALDERGDTVELYFYDFDDIVPEMKAFADDIHSFMEQEYGSVKVYFRQGAEGL